MAATCVQCSLEVRGNWDDGWDVVCPKCTQRGVALAEAREHHRLSGLDPELCIEARHLEGWTQQDLAQHLRLPVGHVAAFEQGHGLAPPEVEVWMERYELV